MKKLTSSFLIFTLLTWIAPTILAKQAGASKQTGDWGAVKKLTGLEIAIKTKTGATSFGLLQFANDAEIRMQVAGKKYLSNQETVFPRDEIRKVWRASLRFSERNTGKGALIGAGIGAGAGVATVIGMRKSGDGQVGLAIPAFAIYGAGIGANNWSVYQEES